MCVESLRKIALESFCWKVFQELSSSTLANSQTLKFNCRQYRATKNNCNIGRKKTRSVCFNSMIAIRNPVLTNRRCYLHAVNKPPPGLLQFKTMSKRFPWHLIILLGSGFALAEACKVTEMYTGSLEVSQLNLKEKSHTTKDLFRDTPSKQSLQLNIKHRI